MARTAAIAAAVLLAAYVAAFLALRHWRSLAVRMDDGSELRSFLLAEGWDGFTRGVFAPCLAIDRRLSGAQWVPLIVIAGHG